jgi:hypothetical protein
MTDSDSSVALSGWQPIVSGNAQLRLSSVATGPAPALRLDFDFQGGGGFVVARRAVARAMPEDYAVSFRVRGHGAVNHLELKLVDAGGQNVWRHVHKDLHLPARWKRMTVASQDIDFAWGPQGSGGMSSLGSLEFAIVAGEGGTGMLWIDDLRIENRTPSEPPTLSASSELDGFPASAALLDTGWKPQPDDLHPWIVIDSVEPRILGGLVVDWLERAPARGYRVAASSDGRRWKTVYRARAAGGRRSYVYLPGLRTRFLRLRLDEASAGARLRLESFEFSRSVPAFWNRIARGEARGWHPRWLHREQSLWTPFGIAAGEHCGLMNDDGMVELDQGSFSIEPMLWIDGRIVTWADVQPRQELLEGWMPVPTVIWEGEGWRLRVTAAATASGGAQVVYRLENLAAAALSARLFVLLRPFQVTPPWQSFRNLGGVSPIHDIAWRDGRVLVDQSQIVAPAAQGGCEFGALGFDGGFIAAHVAAGSVPAATSVHDARGFASAALRFDLALAGHGAAECTVRCAREAQALDAPVFDWHGRIATAQWSGHGWAADAIRAAMTATAHVLITRSGPALQPGPRRYTRSWIRDGAMMGAALLRMGHGAEVREFIEWYAPHQRDDGFVPCCVDREGIDWLVEHDSHGELLALIGDYFRFSGDLDLVHRRWEIVRQAVQYIEGALGPDGLMPVSVSHEGYLAQPVHSYWDGFWTLRGLRDAVDLARAVGREAEARHFASLCTRVAASLYASIEATRARRGLDFIPGSVEWADFDPTATANAIYLLDVPDALDRGAVERTFDKYLADWRGKRSGAMPWTNYTPYEVRIVGALVRLGRRDAALELLRFFLLDRRPPPWNQWPEIAWADHRTPAHLGDLPHTWIAAEYVLAVRCLFAYEREDGDELIIGAGLAPEWLEGEGVRVDAMPTRFGALSYSLRKMDATSVRFDIERLDSPGAALPRVVLRPPLGGPLRSAYAEGGEVASFDAVSVVLSRTPAAVLCTIAP